MSLSANRPSSWEIAVRTRETWFEATGLRVTVAPVRGAVPPGFMIMPLTLPSCTWNRSKASHRIFIDRVGKYSARGAKKLPWSMYDYRRILTGGPMRFIIVVLAIFLTVGLAGTAQQAQAPQAQANGNAVFDRSCASCHRAGEKEVPPPELLRTLTPEAIVNALTIGKMSAQGASLSVAERAAVAQFLTGRAPAVTAVANQPANRCTASTPTADPTR